MVKGDKQSAREAHAPHSPLWLAWELCKGEGSDQWSTQRAAAGHAQLKLGTWSTAHLVNRRRTCPAQAGWGQAGLWIIWSEEEQLAENIDITSISKDWYIKHPVTNNSYSIHPSIFSFNVVWQFVFFFSVRPILASLAPHHSTHPEPNFRDEQIKISQIYRAFLHSLW